MANPVSSRAHDASSNNNILSALQASKGEAARNDGFSRALENSVRSQEQAPPREVNRSENRRQADNSDAARRNRAESRPAETAKQPASSDKMGDVESTRTTPAAEQKTTATEATSAAEEAGVAEETGTEIVPANLAVLASIIAALDKATTAQAPADAEADDDLLGSTRRSAGSVLSDLLEKSAGKRGDAATQAAEKDTARVLAAEAKQSKADAGTLSGNFSRVLATIAQPQAYAAPAATAMQALAAETPAAPGALPNSFIPGMRTEQSGIPQLQIHTPAGQRVWAEEIGNRLTWMVGRGESRAELVLTPPSLGRLGISIQVNGDQTTAHFVASSAAAREALEQALPRLREALQQAGINLGQTDVSTSSDQQRPMTDGQDGRESSSRHRDGSGSASGEMELAPQHSWTQAGTGLIDTFA